jgi:hypothetical protein
MMCMSDAEAGKNLCLRPFREGGRRGWMVGGNKGWMVGGNKGWTGDLQ